VVDLDEDALAAWLADTVDPAISSASVTRFDGGHSSGAWRVDVVADAVSIPLVLKAPSEPSLVFRRDAGREARIIDAGSGARASSCTMSTGAASGTPLRAGATTQTSTMRGFSSVPITLD
jgi:hypothetical protein